MKWDYEEVKVSILWSDFIIKAVHAVLRNFKTYKPLGLANGYEEDTSSTYVANEIFNPDTHLHSDIPEASLFLFISEILPPSGLYL